MAVQVTHEEEHAERARLALHVVEPNHEPPREVPAQPVPQRPGRIELIEAMAVLARILGFRVQLFAAFLGGFGLSAWAVHKADILSIVAACLYGAMIFLPLLFVAYKRA